MTELYDDCNWVNKKHSAIFINGAWYSLSAMEYEMRWRKCAFRDIMNKGLHYNGFGAQFAQMQDELCDCSQEILQIIYPNLNKDLELPIKPKEFVGELSPFEKWREGLDWGTKKQTDDNCTGDLILP